MKLGAAAGGAAILFLGVAALAFGDKTTAVPDAKRAPDTIVFAGIPWLASASPSSLSAIDLNIFTASSCRPSACASQAFATVRSSVTALYSPGSFFLFTSNFF